MANPSLWSSGEAYESYIGRWSRLVAHEFLTWLNVSPGKAWFELGCGTGALTEAILKETRPARVAALEPSETFLDLARRRIKNPIARLEIGDLESLPDGFQDFDVVVSGLVLNFIPDLPSAMRRMANCVVPGGTVAAYVWDYAEGMQLIRYLWDTAYEFDPTVVRLDEGRRDSICNPEALEALFSQELVRPEVRSLQIPTVFRDFDDFWLPFTGGVGPAGAYVASLTPADRERLRLALQSRLPIETDGTIRLTARVWAARGARPQPTKVTNRLSP